MLPGCVRIRDIITVSTQTVDNNQSTLSIIYVQQQKNLVLKRTVVTFTGETDKCKSVEEAVSKLLTEGRDLQIYFHHVN